MNHFRYLCSHGSSLHTPCHDCERSMSIRNEFHDQEESLRLQSPTYQEAMELHNFRMGRDNFREPGTEIVGDNADGIRLFDDPESYLSSLPSSDRAEVAEVFSKLAMGAEKSIIPTRTH